MTREEAFHFLDTGPGAYCSDADYHHWADMKDEAIAALRAKETPPILPFVLYLPTDNPLHPACLTVRDEKTFRQAVNVAVAVGVGYATGWYHQFITLSHPHDPPPFRPALRDSWAVIDQLNGALPEGEEFPRD